MFSEKALNLEEHELRERIRDLPPPGRQLYDELELAGLKDPDHYLRLNWLFPLGLHHFYLGRWERGVINLGLTVSALVLLSSAGMTLYGSMLLVAMVFIEIPQLLNARHLVHSRNNSIMASCLRKVERSTGKR
jgi:TM2 domain-containing membrane protein YozV